jgi:hypothetical protein
MAFLIAGAAQLVLDRPRDRGAEASQALRRVDDRLDALGEEGGLADIGRAADHGAGRVAGPEEAVQGVAHQGRRRPGTRCDSCG